MKIAFIIYNGMTTLDFAGVYDPLVRLKTMGFMSDIAWDVCANTSEVVDGAGLKIMPSMVGLPLNDYDMVIIPGGNLSKEMLTDKDFINWIKTSENCKNIVSVCGGSLILGAAGFLRNISATTHPAFYPYLKNYCANVVHKRIVDEGQVITAGGVTSSIDLGLYLCQKIAGKEAMEKIKKQMDYPYACDAIEI